MKFDTIIIGGGLAGLTCGIKLSRQNKKCLVISSGQSALHFSSGSFDLLNVVENASVKSPAKAIYDLIRSNPGHPYSKIGGERFIRYAAEAKQMLLDSGIRLKGSERENHYRITPFGLLKPTWLTVDDFATSRSEELLPWSKVSIFNVAGFLDFHPGFVAGEFEKLGVKSEIYHIDLPELKALRRNPSELRATNISRLFDNGTALDSLADILKKGSADCDAVLFPACIGLQTDTAEVLSKMIGKPIYLIPTFPPSIAGIRSQGLLKRYFEKSGGVYMLGDSVKNIEIHGDNDFEVFTENHGDISFEGRTVVLATGSFFSQGLVASMERVYEPILDIDLDAESNRQDWYSKNFFHDQNYQRFGAKTDSRFQVMKANETIRNLFAIGALLSGFNALKEGSGSGVSILTAMFVADEILKEE